MNFDVHFFEGPISSAFVNKFGCRIVTIVGAILAGVCIIASSFAQNVLTLIFTIGIGTGFGLGTNLINKVIGSRDLMFHLSRIDLSAGHRECHHVL